MKKVDILKDLTSFDSGWSMEQFKVLVSTADADIASTLYNALKQFETEISFDIGIGTVEMFYDKEEESIVYKFQPSKKLESLIVNSIRFDMDPIVDLLQKSFSKAIMKNIGGGLNG